MKPEKPKLKQESNPELPFQKEIHKDPNITTPVRENEKETDNPNIAPFPEMESDPFFGDYFLEGSTTESKIDFGAGDYRDFGLKKQGFEPVPPNPPGVKEKPKGNTEAPGNNPIPALRFEKDTSCFFMFGVKGSGKSVILSGLFYNLYVHKLAAGNSLVKLNDDNIENQRRGSVLLDTMLQSVPKGNWPPSTIPLRSEGKTLPRQINHEFRPRDLSKHVFKFSIMDFSGEDLQKLRSNNEESKSELHQGIDVFLNLPPQNLAFICVYPASQLNFDNEELSSYARNFLDMLDMKGHRSAPLLFIVSKWDTVSSEFASVSDFLKEKAAMIWGRLNEADRNVTILNFSIGELQGENRFKYDPESSEKMFNWMYKAQMGIDLGEMVSKSFWDKVWNRISKRGKK